MTRNTQNYWIDWLLFLGMVTLILTGIILWGWTRPKNPGEEAQIFWGLLQGSDFLGLTKNGGWKQIHCWVGVGMIPFFLLHILFHLKWIVKTTFGLMIGRK